MKRKFWWSLLPFMVVALCACGKEEHTDGNGDNTGNGNVLGSGFDIIASLSYVDMVYVEGGTFLMGAQSTAPFAPNFDLSANSNESPVHSVTLSSYYIGKYEVTQQFWEYVMNYTGKAKDGSTMTAVESGPWLGIAPSPENGKGDYYPAYYVSYDDVVNYFIPRLNKITGKTFRLPTEAEWEYAARGGNKSKGYKYSGSDNCDDVAWYTGYYAISSPCQVGTKQPNELGIYDMSGNLYEWCSDWYDDSYYGSSSPIDPEGAASGSNRMLRGGSWYTYMAGCRVTSRNYNFPFARSNGYGFRLVYRK